MASTQENGGGEITFERNAFVFIPDPKEVYVPAKVVEPFVKGKGGGKVSRLDGQLGMVNLGIEILSDDASARVMPMDEASVRAHTNMVNLKVVNEAAILHNIRMRFRGDQVYTSVGDILISVNPYKFLPLYTPDVLERYKLHGARDEPPHVYGVADNAWRGVAMAGSDPQVRDQAVIVSGESGSGKTEATKLFLQYIAEMSGGIRTQKEIARGADAPIQEQILRANPLMEAFGNAKTSRNNNSSRFGKFIEVVFSRSGAILGGTVTQYLLEKSRVVEQSAGDRNFHIFYQLLAGANKDAKLKARHRLGEADDFYYLNQNLWDGGPSSKQQQMQEELSGGGGQVGADGKKIVKKKKIRINDESDWEDTSASMEVLEMTLGERFAVFQMVSAILHLGNIRFETVAPGKDEAKVANPDQLNFVATELGCSAEALTNAFVSRALRSGKKKEVTLAPRTVEAAESARDALAKDLYARLFSWLIERVNKSLASDPKIRTKVAGIVKATAGQTSTTPSSQGDSGSSSSTQQQQPVTKRFMGLLSRKAAKGVVATPVNKGVGAKVPAPFPATASASTSAAASAAAAAASEITIGILDIFGFEQFEENGFEQLCINYCNEKLHHFFTRHVFDMEQDEYAREGIKVPSVTFNSGSEKCLALFEGRPQGIFTMLEDEAKINNGSDDGFLFKFLSAQKNNAIVSRPPVTDPNAPICFVIAHYAGQVKYDSTDMVQRNKASIPKDLVRAARSSNLVFVKELFGEVKFGTAATANPSATSPTSNGGNGSATPNLNASDPMRKSKATEDEDVEDLSSFLSMGPDGPGSRKSGMPPMSPAGTNNKHVQQAMGTPKGDRPASRRMSFLPGMLGGGGGGGGGGDKTASLHKQDSYNLNEQEEEESAVFGAGTMTTLSMQFKDQLDDLLSILGECDPHFIRCIKPNNDARGGKFDSVLVMEQLKCAGMLPITQIRQWGFPVRFPYEEFCVRFRSLDIRSAKNGGKALIEQLSSATGGRILKQDAFRLGKTKIFMKNEQALDLEMRRDKQLAQQATEIERIIRGHLARFKYRAYRETLNQLFHAMLSGDEKLLTKTLREVAEIPNHGRHIDVVKDAKALQLRWQEEERIMKVLKDAIGQRNYIALVSGLAAAKEIKIERKADVLIEAKQMVEKINAQKEVHQKLVDAVAANDAKLLASAMNAATKADAMEDEAFFQCVALKSRASELAQITQDLDRALKNRSIVQTNALIARGIVLGIPMNDSFLSKARQTRQALRQEESAVRLVDFACERRDENDLKIALAKADAFKATIKADRLKAAKDLKLVLEKESAAAKQLAQATIKNDPIAIEQAIKNAESIGLDVSTNSVVVEATKSKSRNKLREAANTNMVKAVEAANASGVNKNDALTMLSSAILEAAKCGVNSGRAQSECTLALKALGKKGELIVQMSDAIFAGDADTLDGLMTRARKDGIIEEALAPGRAVLGELKQEEEIGKDLVEAMGLGDVQEIVSILQHIHDDFDNFAKRNHYIYEKAKGVVAAVKTAAAAIKYRDFDLIENAIQVAQRAGAQHIGPVAEIEQLKEKLLKEREFVARIASIPLENVSALREALKQAPKDTPLDQYDEIVDAKAVVERQDKIEKAHKLIEEAGLESDLDKLNAALNMVIDLGIQSKLVDSAFQLRIRLESQQEIIGELLVDVDTMRIRMQGKNGIQATDVQHVMDAIAKAKQRGLPSHHKQLLNALQLMERMKRQVVIQEELKSALASRDFTALKLSMDHAQESEVDIELAAQVRAAVRALDAERRAAQRAAFQASSRNLLAGQQQQQNNSNSITPMPTLAEGGAAATSMQPSSSPTPGGSSSQQQQSLNDSTVKKELEARLQRAAGVRYKWERFNDIRSDEDYSKGSGRSKAKVIETKLVSQTSVIPKSMLVLDKTLNKVAVKINKDVLGYCGDKAMSFPPSLARDMLQKGLEFPPLADEIYVQLCKHITKNPKADSAGKAWQLMCMSVSTFPPSSDFEPYLLNFLQSNVNVPGLVSNYARFAMRRLEGMLTTGPTGFVPSIEEIAAYKERPPILATIELVDGTPLTQGLPVTPDLDAERVVDLCIHFLGLKDPRAKQLFAIFVVDDTEKKKERLLEEKRLQVASDTGKRPMPIDNPNELPRSPKFLANNEYLGSVIVQMTRLKHDFTFVFKRKLHLGGTSDRQSDDPMFRRLIYLQAQDSFINGDVPVNDLDQVINLISVAVAADNEPFPDTVEKLLDDSDVISYVPRMVRRAKTDRDWAKAVLNAGAQFASEPSEYLQDKFVDILKRNELYGSMFFHALRANEGPDVVMLPNHLVIAVNYLGVHVIDSEARRKGIIRTIRFDHIKRWGGSAKYFSLSVLKGDKAMETVSETTPGLIASSSSNRLKGLKNSESPTKTKHMSTGGMALDKNNSYELALNTPQASELSVVMTEYVNALIGVGMLGGGNSRLSKTRSRRLQKVNG